MGVEYRDRARRTDRGWLISHRNTVALWRRSGTVDPVIVTCPDCGKKNRVPRRRRPAARGCAQCHHDLPWLADASDADFTDVVERSPLPVVVDLWAPWCGPCRMISPALEDVATRLRGRMKLVKVNVDDNPSTAARFGVQGIPTLLVFRDGQLVDTSVGARGASELQAWIEPLVDARRLTHGGTSVTRCGDELESVGQVGVADQCEQPVRAPAAGDVRGTPRRGW